MSHFNCLVISRKGRSVESLLAPYDEELECAPRVYKTKSQIISEALAELVEAKMGTNENIRKSFYKDIQEFFNNSDDVQSYTDEQLYRYGIRFEDEDHINDQGDIISYSNPQGYWDWYTYDKSSSRWTSDLILKDGTRTNRAFVKDIDWEAMNTPTPEDLQYYKRFWRVATRKEEAKKGENLRIWKTPEYYLSTYKNEDNFIRCMTQYAAYAVIDAHGMWHAQGEMGWWGVSLEKENATIDWHNGFMAMILKMVRPDDEIIIVDCHI